MKTLLKLTVAGLFALCAVLLPACNTTKGFGQDIDSLGENIEEAAHDTGATRD